MALIWLCLMLIGLVKIYTPLKRYFQFGNGTDVTEDISRPADRPKYPNLIVAVILISIPFLVFSQYHSYENLRENLPFKYPFMELLTYIVNPILDAAYIVLQIVLVSVGLWIWHGLSGYRGRLERGMSTGFKLFAFSWWIRFVLIYCIQSIFSHQITTYMFRNSDASFHSILTYIEIIYLVFTILQVIVSFLILYAFFMILNFFHHVPRIDSFDNDLGWNTAIWHICYYMASPWPSRIGWRSWKSNDDSKGPACHWQPTNVRFHRSIIPLTPGSHD